jgi:predicted RNA-binding protein with PUA-like domain
MSLGDKVFFYHSSCKVPGITGVAEVSFDSPAGAKNNAQGGSLLRWRQWLSVILGQVFFDVGTV